MPRFGAADGARPEADRRPPGQLPVRLGHERGAALVARGDDPDPGALERVEQAQERFAGDRERVAHAGRAEGVGDEPADGPWSGSATGSRSGAAGSAARSAGSVGRSALRRRRSPRALRGQSRPRLRRSSLRARRSRRLRQLGRRLGLVSRLGSSPVGSRRARSRRSRAALRRRPVAARRRADRRSAVWCRARSWRLRSFGRSAPAAGTVSGSSRTGAGPAGRAPGDGP